MNDVSCRLIADEIDFFVHKGWDPQQLLSGLPTSDEDARRRLDDLRNDKAFVDWSTFVAITDVFYRVLVQHDAVTEYADRMFDRGDNRLTRAIRPAARLSVHLKHVYRILQDFAGRAVVRPVAGTYEELPDGRLKLTCEIEQGYENCPPFFEMTRLTMERLPYLLGLPMAVVHMDLKDLTGVYYVTLPPASTLRMRIKRWLTIFFSAPRAIAMLAASEAEVRENYYRLQRSEAELQQVRRGLELRVAERTRQLAEAKELAEAANKAKSTFLANMSHELRTPLASILGFTGLMLKADPGPDKRQRYLEIIERNGRHLGKLLNDVLDFAKVEAGHVSIVRAPFDCAHEIAQAVSSFAAEAEKKGVSIELRLPPTLPVTVSSDAVRFRQILLNVIGNAVKFMREGRIDVVAETVDVSANSRREIAVTVRDTGCGIAAKDHDAIFQPFMQADLSTTRRFGGTGLGLTLARNLARALGGDVVLQHSAIGEGSTFRITIDISGSADAAIPVDLASACRGNQARLSGTRVLIVEDRDDIRDLYKIMLEDEGALVTTSSDGDDGFERALHGGHDVVMLDIQMPRRDGFDVARGLRSSGYRKPLIAVTSYARPEERFRSLEAGFDDHLSKPVDAESLVAAIGKWRGEAFLRTNEAPIT